MKKTIYLFCLLICGSITLQAQTLERIAKQKADSIANAVEQQMQNMSFEEFEAFANSSPYRGQFTRAELKRDYNKMHKNDGKAVKIYPQDYEKTDYQKLSDALEAMKKAKTYAEYRRYAKIVFPDVSEEELKEGWKEQQKKNARNSNVISNTENKNTTNESENNEEDEDASGLEDLFGGDEDTSNDQKGGQEGSQGESNGGTIDLNSFDLGSLLDFAESNEAAEMSKKANELKKEMKHDEMERMVAELESKMKSEKDFFMMAGMSEREARITAAADSTNKDPHASVEERERKLREYFRMRGTAPKPLEDFCVYQILNTDPPKGIDTKYDDSRKRDYEENTEDYESEKYKLKFDEDEMELIIEDRLRDDYGIKVPKDMSRKELRELTRDFMKEFSRQRPGEDAFEKCLNRVIQRHLLNRAQ